MFKKTTLLILLAFLLQMLSAGAAQAQAPDPKSINIKDYALNVTDYRLPNGLRVILAKDQSAPVVAVDIWYHVGGANDPEHRAGFAHLFEHMMFEGSAHVANGEWDKLLESIGAKNNAYTENDKTAFWEVAPANQLPRVLWMESDRMASLDVTQGAFDTERQVVIQEYNQRVANQPFGYANLRLFTQPMDGYPPYERPVIGNVDDLNAASLKEVQDFHSKYYRPNNATMVIVGDIDVEQTEALVQAYFGGIPAGPELTPILQQYPMPAAFPVSGVDPATGCKIGTEETLIDPKVQVPRLGMTVVGPARGAPNYYAFRLLTDILSGGDSSRIQQNIVQQGLAAGAFAGVNEYLGASIFYAAALPNSGGSLDDMRTLLIKEFTDVRTKGVTEEELARVKQQEMVNILTSYRSSVMGTAEWLQDFTLSIGDPNANAVADELARYDAVTVKDVQQAAQSYLCDKPMNFQTVLPKGQEHLSQTPGPLVQAVTNSGKQTAGAAEPPVMDVTAQVATLPKDLVNRTGVPASLGELQTNLPPFETFTLDNGLHVIFVAQHKVPKLRLELVVGGSNTAAPADKQGVADIMADLLSKGTLTRSGATIAQSIEAVGGSVSTNASLEWTTISVDALATDSQLAFDLLSDMARHATFPQKEFDVDQKQTLTFLQQDAVNPDSMANREFGRIAYGGHPYGYVTDAKTVGGLTRQDVVDFYNTYYKPNNALLVIVGDMTPDQARFETQRVFQYWRQGTAPNFLDYPKAEVGDTSVIHLVDRPNAQQATVQVGNRAINARNPDRYALEVVNAILGGGSSSRLFVNLRENKGYTYGVYSRFAHPNDVGTFRVIGNVNKDHVGDAVTEILKELQKIRTEPISDQEIALAKGMLTGSFALSIENAADFADQLAVRYLTGIPIDELKTYPQKLEAVTAEQAHAAAAQYIDSQHPIIVVVGDAKTLKPQLEKVEPVVVVNNAGQPIQ